MGEVFNQLIFYPIFNLLVFIYNTLPRSDFGVAIIALTILTRLLFVPLSIKTLRSQKELTMLQPKLKEIQEKYKNDRQALGRATMELYREHKVNPFSGCLPLLIQLPVLIALYQAFRTGLDPKSLDGLYSFVKNPGSINQTSLGFINLTLKNPPLAILAGALQFFQSRLSLVGKSDSGTSQRQGAQREGNIGTGTLGTGAINRQMLYFFPIMVILISWNLPTGLVIYWVVTTIFSILEQWYINRQYPTS
ncbi:MAG: membrane protein insertase YidC [Parcubacteria group bacterium]|nr:membrane protein insertase YidC [Parcubacteria group bacterium]